MKTTRRAFLAAAGAAAGTLVLPRRSHALSDGPLKIGVIGVGWYGMVDAKAALSVGGVEIVAVCDVDSEHLKAAADEIEKLQASRPKELKDYQELLELPGLNAVIIGTPPQWHALPFIAAVEKGPHVYCEKPVAYDIREGRAMVDAAKASKSVVQFGFQRRQSLALKEVSEFIKKGGIGKLVQVDAQIHYQAGTGDTTPQDPPPSLDWEQWTGPAPLLPYCPQIGHKSWRLEKTTGHGHLVDWGIHLIDATRMVLGLAMPTRVTADGGLYYLKGKITTPDTLTAHFEFDRLPVVWRHRLWGAAEYTPETDNGILFYGDEATVFAADRTWTVIPKGKNSQRQQHEVPADLGKLHMANFLDAVRTGAKVDCPIEEAARSTAMVQLAMIAYETQSVVHWDQQAEQIVDNAEAARLLQREYRAPYKHPYPYKKAGG